jgi:hypothetical protein
MGAAAALDARGGEASRLLATTMRGAIPAEKRR